MEGYIVDNELINIVNGVEFTSYIPSIDQKRRKERVIRQLLSIWNKVYKTLSFLHETCNINDIMQKVYKLWMIEYYADINYYSDELIKNRQKPNYRIKKLNKLRNTKYLI